MNTYDLEVTITVEADTEEEAEDMVLDLLSTDLGVKEFQINTIIRETKV